MPRHGRRARILTPDVIDSLDQCDHDAAHLGQPHPLSPRVLAKIQHHLRVSLTYSSNPFEASTLSLQEMLVALAGPPVAGKPLGDYFAAVDHAGAFDFVWSLVSQTAPLTGADVRHSSPGPASGRAR
ncbi:MAG: hypothetical protein M0Z54_09160 [Thermaerobacter sp.]|nr:hypothetical protein [Thermaerobacter sp.]